MGANDKPRRAGSKPFINVRELDTSEEERERVQQAVNRATQQLQWELDEMRRAALPVPIMAPVSPPAPSTKPPPSKAHWLAHLTAAFAGLAALIGVLVTLVNALAQLRKPPDGMVSKVEFEKALAQQRSINESTRAYENTFRLQAMGIWELQGFKLTDPVGVQPHVPLELLPPPLVSQTRRGTTNVPAAPLLQLAEPIVAPPPLP